MLSTSRSNKLKLFHKDNKTILSFIVWFISMSLGICGYDYYYCHLLWNNKIALSTTSSYTIALYSLFMLVLGVYISVKLLCNCINHRQIERQLIYAVSLFCSFVAVPCGSAWIVLLFNNAHPLIIIISFICLSLNFPISCKFISLYDKSNLLSCRFFAIWFIVTSTSILALMLFGDWTEEHYEYIILLMTCICAILFGLALLFKIKILSKISIKIFILYDIVMTIWLWNFAGILFLPSVLILMITNFYATFKLSKCCG